jgi:ribonuclease HI
MQASIHFGNQEWAGKVNRTYSDIQLVEEARIQLGLEGTWQVRHAVTILDVRTIEAERVEEEIERAPLPRDSEVVFDYHGTQKSEALKARATAWDQAQTAQRLFGETLVCNPIQETGDHYTIQVYKPSVFRVIFVKGDDQIRSWVDNTKTKVAQEEERRLFGGKPVLELLAETGLVYQVQTGVSRSSKPKRKPESNTRQMTGAGIKPVGPPSISHRRATPKPDISQRSIDGRDMECTGKDLAVGYRGVDIHVMLPQKMRTIKGIALSRDASRAQIAELITKQLRVDPLHPDFIELAPSNWFETRELSARFRYDRPDLNSLSRVTYEQFRERMDLTKPMVIETDGACSGNPGPGGWGFLVTQGDMKIEAFGAEGLTSNNEMEWKAIDEALGFFKNVRGHAVIESDSEGCLAVMMGRGEQWEADNYIHLNGEAVKNRELVQNIVAKLKSVNVQFRKVLAHHNDQWNVAADALAAQGRDDAINWPKCSFDVVIPDRTIAFGERSMRDYWTTAEVYAELKKETEERLPVVRDMKLFKNGTAYGGKWTSGHYQLVHKSLPAPLAQEAPRPAVPRINPAIFGIWDSRNPKPTRPLDISRISCEERLRIFNEVHPIGNEVASIKPGQPYTVYPRKFPRQGEVSAKTKDKINPVRMEGPFIHIQWMLLSDTGEHLMLPTSAVVPEEISLPQLWHKSIANRCRLPAKSLSWGRHFRGGVEVESGKVTELLDGDGVEVVISNKTKEK